MPFEKQRGAKDAVADGLPARGVWDCREHGKSRGYGVLPFGSVAACFHWYRKLQSERFTLEHRQDRQQAPDSP
jgi:hypothetical protein